MFRVGLARHVPSVLLLASGAVCVALLAWARAFSTWVEYDDQGFFMLAMRHVLDGHAPYDEVPFMYGPAHFGWRWLLHDVAGIPVTVDAVRMITASTCFVAVLCGAAWVFRSTSSIVRVPCALVALAAGTEMLTALANEPAHAQEFIVILCGLTLVCAPRVLRGRPRTSAVLLGLVAGALIASKVNVGLLFTMAVLGHFESRFARGPLSAWLRAAWLCLLAALPLVLMRADLHREWGPETVITTVMSMIAMTFSARPAAHETRVRTVVVLALAVIAGVAACIVFAMARGSTPAGILRCTVLEPMQLPQIFPLFAGFGSGAMLVAASSLALLLALRSAPERLARAWTPWIAGAARLALVIVWLDPGHHGLLAMVSFGPPLVPLALLPLGSPREPIEPARHLVGWLSVVFVLMTYPVPGTQCVIASYPTIFLIVVLVGETLATVLCAERSLARARTAAAAGWLASACVVWPFVQTSWREYQAWRSDPWRVNLPGTSLLAMPPAEVLRCRWMAQNLEAHSSRFVAAWKTSSLHLWTTREPPTLDVISPVWQLVPRARQELMIAALEREPVPMVAMHTGLLRRPNQWQEPFVTHVRENYRLWAQFEGFQLYVRRTNPPLELVCSAWLPAPEEAARLPEPVRAEIERERGVLVVSPPPELAERAVVAVRCADVTQTLPESGTDIGPVEERLRVFDEHGALILGEGARSAASKLGARCYVSVPSDRAFVALRPKGQVCFYVAGSAAPFARVPIVDRRPPPAQ